MGAADQAVDLDVRGVRRCERDQHGDERDACDRVAIAAPAKGLASEMLDLLRLRNDYDRGTSLRPRHAIQRSGTRGPPCAANGMERRSRGHGLVCAAVRPISSACRVIRGFERAEQQLELCLAGHSSRRSSTRSSTATAREPSLPTYTAVVAAGGVRATHRGHCAKETRSQNRRVAGVPRPPARRSRPDLSVKAGGSVAWVRSLEWIGSIRLREMRLVSCLDYLMVSWSPSWERR